MQKSILVIIGGIIGMILLGAVTGGTDGGVMLGGLLGAGATFVFYSNAKNVVNNKIDASKAKNIQDEMIRTKELFDKNILTEAEYETKIADLKQKLL